MRKGMIALLAALSMAAFMSGCASNEAVKTEEPIAATTKAEPAVTTAEPAKAAEETVKPAEEQGNKAVAAVSAFETVYFDFDKSELRQDARDVLSKNADLILKDQSGAKVKIEGHCDERGSAEYNIALGERRAKSTMQYLVTLGVKADRLSVISYGKEKPAVQGSDEAAWSKNRRAEFVIVK
jgi:peptidoglycan-associated lipoprotein